MRHLSVKTRLAVWITVLMALLAALLAAFMLLISSAVATQTAMSQLAQTVQSGVEQVGLADGKLTLSGSFPFYRSGVTVLVYSWGEALLAGQVPVSFTAAEPFENGTTRTVDAGDARYLLLDLFVPMGWEDGVWLRGILEAPDNRRLTGNLLTVALAALPAFMLLAALGSWLIARRAFRPLDDIAATASAISEARDLSRRIALPPGKDEFTRLAGTFDELFERLERSFEAEKQFAADASHELRTPVSIIKGACEYAERYDETPQERRETIAMIHRQAVRMSALIAQLLSMTRLEQGTEPAHMEDVDLSELLPAVCGERGYDSERVTCEAEGGLTIRADSALLTRLIENLVENALKYGGPHVRVTACRRGEEILLEVRDDGMGIPREHQERVWQRFYQVDPSRSGEEGAGLGLALVQQIARLHGGFMTLESAPGKGCAFALHLPAGGPGQAPDRGRRSASSRAGKFMG